MHWLKVTDAQQSNEADNLRATVAEWNGSLRVCTFLSSFAEVWQRAAGGKHDGLKQKCNVYCVIANVTVYWGDGPPRSGSPFPCPAEAAAPRAAPMDCSNTYTGEHAFSFSFIFQSLPEYLWVIRMNLTFIFFTKTFFIFRMCQSHFRIKLQRRLVSLCCTPLVKAWILPQTRTQAVHLRLVMQLDKQPGGFGSRQFN